MKYRWLEEELWNLYNLTLPQCIELYPECKHIRTTRLQYIRKINKGEVSMPERHTFDGDLEKEQSEISKRQGKAAPKLGELATLQVSVEHLKYHEKLQEALNEDGAVSKMRISEYQMGYKDADGEAQSHDLHAVRFELEFDSEPQWPPVTRVESVKLQRKEKASNPGDARKAVILPDLQIPYQDEKALEVALKIVRDVKPDKVVLIGDLLDLEAFSRFDNLPTYAGTTQDAIVRAHQLLAEIRKMCPTAEIAVLEGNHDLRLSTHINKNAKSAYGLRRADQPEGWPVLSVPYLTAMDDLDVDYISGYPANRYWINQNLQVQHGHRVRSAGSTAKVVSENERVSTIFGHIHRLETQYRTHQTYEGGKTNAAFGVGCLCKIDGSVPSTNRGVDLMGKSVTNHENWQNAICVVDYQEGDSAFNVNPVYINTFENYRAVYNGKLYQA
jgi:hypothetical protein